MLQTLWSGMQCGKHHGRGIKARDKCQHDDALKHFKAGLKCAELTGNEGTIAFEMECIARTYEDLGKVSEAKEFAEKCLALYNKLLSADKEDCISARVSGVQDLLLRLQDQSPTHGQVPIAP